MPISFEKSMAYYGVSMRYFDGGSILGGLYSVFLHPPLILQEVKTCHAIVRLIAHL